MTVDSAPTGGGRRRITALVVVIALILLGGGAWWALTPKDSSAPPAAGSPASGSPSPAASDPGASPSPAPPLSAQAMDGLWHTDQADAVDFAVRGDLVVYADGRRARVLSGEDGDPDFVSVIADGAKTCDEGEAASCAPLGQLVPKGTAVQIPDYAEGVNDDVSVDRIWDGQAGILYVRGALSAAADFPSQVQGIWCTADGTACFSIDTLLTEHPLAFANGVDAVEGVPGASDITLCLVRDRGADGCTTSASMFLRHFPKGVAWDCDAYVQKAGIGEITSCRPDTVIEHDTSRARLIVLPNHQHDAQYIDSPPMYRK